MLEVDAPLEMAHQACIRLPPPVGKVKPGCVTNGVQVFPRVSETEGVPVALLHRRLTSRRSFAETEVNAGAAQDVEVAHRLAVA